MKIIKMIFSIIILLPLLACFDSYNIPNDEENNNRIDVIILGTYHFSEQGSHLTKLNKKEILNKQKQVEIESVRELLLKFKPTKIAVEADIELDHDLHMLYKNYLNSHMYVKNSIFSESNEIFQLSFPLARNLGHEKLYAIDKSVDLPVEVFDYVKKSNPQKYNDYINELNIFRDKINSKINNDSMLEVLKFLNDPIQVDYQHSNFFLKLSEFSSGSETQGIDTLTEWYRRNLHIFSNLQDLIKENDKILVIYGSDHIKLLSDFVDESDKMNLIDINTYLK